MGKPPDSWQKSLTESGGKTDIGGNGSLLLPHLTPSEEKKEPAMSKTKTSDFKKVGKNLLLSTVMATAILIGIGYAGAKDWNEAELKKKIARLGKTLPDPSKSPLAGQQLEALTAVVEVLNAGGDVIIGAMSEAAKPADEDDDDDDDDDEDDADDEDDEDDEDAEDEDDEDADDGDDEEEAPAKSKSKSKKPAAEEAPAKSKSKSKKPAAEEADDEDDAPAEKSKKKNKKAKSAGGPVKVGIIDAIITILKGASKKAPMSKKEIVSALADKFPDREPEKMAATVGVQVPYFLKKKGIAVVKLNNAFYISKNPKPAEAEAEAGEVAATPAKKNKKNKKPAAE